MTDSAHQNDADPAADLAAERSDPAASAPAEGQSHDIPAQDRGQDQGGDPTYDSAPAEGARDED